MKRGKQFFRCCLSCSSSWEASSRCFGKNTRLSEHKMSVQLFKAILPLLLQAEETERRLLMSELKTVLHRYLEPLLG
jgi:hypothetical protein